MAGLRSTNDHHDYPQFPVVPYIKCYGARRDGRRLTAMRLVGGAEGIRGVRTGRMCDTTVGARNKQ